MGKLVNYISSLHTSTSRLYIDRMNDNKIECMIKAKKYGRDYWDGDRRYGYGGYKYIPGRWKSVAEKLIQQYNLDDKSNVLDVGCGSGILSIVASKLGAARAVGLEIDSNAVKTADPIANPLPVAAVVLPNASKASVRSLTSGFKCACSAIPPALSATGPYASVARVIPKVESIPTAAKPIP